MKTPAAEMHDARLVNTILLFRGQGARGHAPPPDAAEQVPDLEAEAARRGIDVATFKVHRAGDRPRMRRRRQGKPEAESAKEGR